MDVIETWKLHSPGRSLLLIVHKERSASKPPVSCLRYRFLFLFICICYTLPLVVALILIGPLIARLEIQVLLTS